jgi:hypothetical protein
MNTLFVAWRSSTERSWFTVGRLSSHAGRFRFDYTHGTKQASRAGFQAFSAFPDLFVTYESERLFPFFANRLLSRSRREFDDFVRWVSPHDMEEDPIALLARSGGHRKTDSLELFPEPKKVNGWYHLHFFAHGLSHMPVAAGHRAERLQESERLLILKDVQNPFDSNALVLRTEERNDQDFFFMGFVPRYLAKDVSPILEASSAKVRVIRVNPPPAPIQFRVLCCLKMRPPEGSQLFSGEEFIPLNADRRAAYKSAIGTAKRPRRFRDPG